TPRPPRARGATRPAARRAGRTSRTRAALPPGRSPDRSAAGLRSAGAAQAARRGRARRRSSWRQYAHSPQQRKFLGELLKEIAGTARGRARPQRHDDLDPAAANEADLVRRQVQQLIGARKSLRMLGTQTQRTPDQVELHRLAARSALAADAVVASPVDRAAIVGIHEIERPEGVSLVD